MIPQDIMPLTFVGTTNKALPWNEIDWLRGLGKNVFFALWLRNPSLSSLDLPLGHDLYVLTFHYEPFDVAWIMRQINRITATIIILNDGEFYNFPTRPNVFLYSYYSWQKHIDQIIEWFPTPSSKNIKYKTSAVCNRITQSKLIIFTALLEELGESSCLVKLSDWLEQKNIHYGEKSGNVMLDSLTDIFFNKYFGKLYTVDNFVNSEHNVQRINSNPWSIFYTSAALHFTNESHHYSLMKNNTEDLIYPGPHMTEKTFKCLIAGVSFIPVAQFNTYENLKRLGLKFDYGLDLTWDQDPGNLTRLSGIVKLIQTLKDYSVNDLIEMTQDSTNHNSHMVWSGDFQKNCRAHNENIANEILTKFSK